MRSFSAVTRSTPRTYSTVLWDKNALAENDISEVEEISLPLKVYADEDIGNPYVDETFELTPGLE